MQKQDQLEELLVDWELQRQQGHELTAAEVCTQHPELEAELSQLISDFRATDWLEDDADPDDDFLHLPDFSTLCNQADETQLPECSLSLEDFCQRLVESGLMEQEQVDQLQQRFEPDNTRSFARQLVENKKLTTFQATVLLEGQDIPLVLDRYVLLGEIGKGGMGAVYKALHQQMDRVVALKILPKEAVDSPEKVKRFHREVRAAAKLHHANIVTAFDAREDKGVHFLVMEYVTGSDLAALVRNQGRLSVAQAVDYITQAARGLEHAHQLGIVHRDIKPGNLLLNKKGKVKILDMGLARIDAGERNDDHTVSMELTEAGAVMGTVAYLPPEQALDTRTADARSDIYSLGCTLYYLLSGKAIYAEDTMMKTIMAHREHAIPALCAQRERITPELDAVFQRMVAKQPADRIQSMTEVISALESLEVEDTEDPQPVVAGSQAFHDTATCINTSREAIQPEPVSAGGHAKRRRGWIAAYLLVLAGLGGAWAAGIFLKVDTPAGMIVLEIDQPELAGAVVSVDGEKKITIQTGEGQEPIEVSADEKKHTLKVVKGGFETFTKEFSVKAGGKQTIEVRLEPVGKETAAKPKPFTPPADGEWDDRKVAEWVLRSGYGYVRTTVDEGQLHRSDVLPKEPFRIVQLTLHGEMVPNDMLGRLRTLPSLNTLAISTMHMKHRVPDDRRSPLTDLGLSHVGKLPALTAIQLWGCKEITDLSQLQSLARLKRLDVRNCPNVTDQGIGPLLRHRTLSTLHLQELSVTGEAFRDVRASPTLTQVHLIDCKLNDDGMQAIGKMKHLDTLHLRGSRVTDKSLHHLRGLTNLEVLYVRVTKVTPQGIAELQKALPNCKIDHESLDNTDPGEWDDRKVAEWVLSIGGSVGLKGDKSYQQGDELPKNRYEISSISLPPFGYNDQELSRLIRLFSLNSLKFGEMYLYNREDLVDKAAALTDEGLAHVARLPQLQSLHISQLHRVTDAGLAHLAQLTTLTEIAIGDGYELNTINISDQGLAYLSTLPNLSRVVINTTEGEVTDEGVSKLVEIPVLEHLWLRVAQGHITGVGLLGCDTLKVLQLHGAGFSLNDQGLEAISGMNTLRVLELGVDLNVTERGVAHLSGLKELRNLTMSSPEITDGSVQSLRQMSQLERLDIRGTKVTPEGIAELQKALPKCEITHESLGNADPGEWDDRKVAEWVLSNGSHADIASPSQGKKVFAPGDALPEGPIRIFGLQLSHRAFDDDDLSRLANLESMQTLQLGVMNQVPDGDEGLSNAGMLHIGKLTNLRMLSLYGPYQLTDAGLALLKGLKQLDSLEFHRGTSTFTDQGLAQLAELPNLRALAIEQAEGQITGVGLKSFKDLEDLALAGDGMSLNEAGLQAIGQLGNLRQLGLHYSGLDDNTLSHCQKLTKLKYLTAYRFDGPSKITDAGVKYLLDMTELQKLGLAHSQITDLSMPILEKFPKLEHLDVRATKVTPQGIAELQKALPNCKIEHESLDNTDPGKWDDRKVAEWVLSVGGTVNQKYRQGDELPESPLTVQVLSLPSESFDDSELARLVVLDGLFALTIGGITDIGMEHIGKLDGLKYLTIYTDNEISDSGLAHLRGVESLERLSIECSKGCRISDDGLVELSRLHHKLQRLTIINARINGTGLRGFDKLQQLVLKGPGVSFNDAGAEAIGLLNSLESLTLDVPEADDDLLKHCANLTGLHSLTVRGWGVQLPKITDAGVKYLVGMKELKQLSLQGSQTTDECLAVIKTFDKLNTLSLRQTKTTDAGVQHLKSLKGLTFLNLEYTNVTSQGIAELQKALPNCKIEHDFTEEEIKAAAQGSKPEETSDPAPAESKSEPDDE